MAEQEIKAGIKIEVQTNGTEQIKQLNQAIDDVPESLQQAREQAEKLKQVWQQDSANQNAKMAYVRAAGEVKKLEQSLQSLQTQAEQSEKSLSYFAKKAEKLQVINQDKQTLGLDIDEQARQEIDKLNQAFVRLKESGTLSQKELARAADLHRDKIYRLEKSLGDLRPSLSDVADEIQTVVQKTAGLAFAANEAMKFETAMAAVKKVTEGSAQQYEQLSGSLKTLGAELGIMPEQLAQIAAQGGQMGMNLEKLPEFTRMAAQMSVAFGITAEQAGEMAAKTANVFQLNQAGLQQLGDTINTLGNTTAAKEAEISEVLMRIGGNAKQFGLAAEEAAALGAAFISLGKTPEVAGTAINALLSKLQNAKLGNDEFKNSLKDLGLSAEEMAQNIAANPQAALDDFLQRLQKLDAQARSETLGKLFGAEYSDDLALLVGSLKTYQDALATATDREKTFGAMQKETEAALNTTAKKLDQAKAKIVSAAIDLGNTLLPMIQGVATAVGSVTTTLSDLGQQFPILTQLAGLFFAAKAATAGLQVAMRLMGAEGVSSFVKTDIGVKKLKASILETATAAQVLGANIKAATTGNVNDINLKINAVSTLGSKLAGAAQSAVALYSAFEVGHSVGTALREQSTLVRDLGDNLGKAYAYFATLWDGNTFDDVSKYYRTTRQELREQEKLQREAAKAANEKAAKEKQAAEAQAQQIQQLNQKYRDLQDRYNGNETSLRALTAAGKENSAMAQNLRDKNVQLATQLGLVKNELAELNAKISDVSPLAKNRQALLDLGLTAEQVATGISKTAKTAIDDFALAAQGFGNDADSMAMIFQAAVKKMDTPEALAELQKSLVETGTKAGLTAEQIDRIAQSAPQAGLGLGQISKALGEAEKSASALGVELKDAFSGSSPAMQTALSHFATLRGQLAELAKQGFDVGFVVQQSLSKMTETAQSKADIDALKNAINSLKQSGMLSFGEIERAILAADMRLQDIKNTIDPTEAAFQKLGIKTKEAMRLSAEETRLAFEAVKSSGQATADDLKKAFEQTANDLLATGNQQQRAWVESQAAAYNYKVTVDATGKAALQAAAETKAASEQKVAAHKQEAAAAEKSAQAQTAAQKQATEETKKSTQAIEKQGKSLNELGEKVYASMNKIKGWRYLGTSMWSRVIKDLQDMHISVNRTIKQLNADMENGGNLAASLAKAEAHVIANAQKLDKVTLSNLNSAIAKARQQMQALADEAENAQRAAEKRLLQAQGKDDEVQKMELQAELKALRKQQEQAQKMGNEKAVASYERAIATTRKAFEEERQRQERERAEQERQAQEQAQREREREQQQREAIQAAPSVSVQTDVNELINLLSKRDDLVANQAIKQLLGDLENALSQQR